MAQFQKKPVIIEAIQFTGKNQLEVLSFTNSEDVQTTSDQIIIETLEGSMRANPGDYIIRGVKGELYPCKPDIFEQTYEKPDTMRFTLADLALVVSSIPNTMTVDPLPASGKDWVLWFLDFVGKMAGIPEPKFIAQYQERIIDPNLELDPEATTKE